MIKQIRKAVLNGAAAFLLITFGDSIWNMPIITIPAFMFFLIQTTFNVAKIDYLNGAIRSRKNYPSFYRQDTDDEGSRDNISK